MLQLKLKMWCLAAVIAYLCGLSSGIEDLSQMLCSDVSNGEILPNPRDCNSYFICGIVPMITYCDQGLHFDVDNKVCNLPEIANCQFDKINILTNNNTESQTTTPDYTTPKELNLLKTELDSNENINLYATDMTPQHIYFIALDVNTRKPVDPMQNYEPLNVACNHYGTYFLPHPNDCSSYYICAFGHMMQHKCGRGAGWSYKRQMCEVRPLTECYAPQVELCALFSNEQLFNNPPTSEMCTLCYASNNDITGPPTNLSWSSNGETTRFILTDPQLPPTSPTLVPADISDGNVPNCPKNIQMYLPHSTDCSKYYICIIGMAFLTSCPEGLFWDQTAEFCDSPSNVMCP